MSEHYYDAMHCFICQNSISHDAKDCFLIEMENWAFSFSLCGPCAKNIHDSYAAQCEEMGEEP